MAQTIKCPSCGFEISLDAAVSQRIREELQADFEKKVREREQEYARKTKDLTAREEQLKASQLAVDQAVAQKLAAERAKVEADAKKKATEAAGLELTDLKNQVAEKAEALAQAQQKELELRQQQRQLDDAKKSLELDVTRRMDEERKKVLEQADEQHRLKDRERDRLIEDMKKQLAEAQRRAEQGSQQAQGEVLELDLEEQLRQMFPLDAIEPVPKGTRGADVIHRILDRAGRTCGTILWEAKRTRNWGATWVQKLKDDQREAKADLAILLTTAMPKGIETFGQQESVWVTNQSCAMSLGTALRESLVHIAAARVASTGKQSKMEMLYDYLSGPDFRGRVETIVEAFMSLKKELDKEKAAMNGIWARREKQLDRVLTNTAGMYGDLQSISGASLPKIEHLELKAIGEGGEQE